MPTELFFMRTHRRSGVREKLVAHFPSPHKAIEVMGAWNQSPNEQWTYAPLHAETIKAVDPAKAWPDNLTVVKVLYRPPDMAALEADPTATFLVRLSPTVTLWRNADTLYRVTAGDPGEWAVDRVGFLERSGQPVDPTPEGWCGGHGFPWDSPPHPPPDASRGS